jgi:hypothetical protein
VKIKRKPKPEPDDVAGLTMVAPKPWTEYQGRGNKRYLSTLGGRIYNVRPEDTSTLLDAGCRRVLPARWP